MTDPLLCHAALARHGLRARRLTPLAANVARVDAVDGRRYALRCTRLGDRAFGNVPLELAWTAALRADTDVRPPKALPGLDGQLVQEVAVLGAPETHDCVLSEWVPPGPELARRLTPATHVGSERSPLASTPTPSASGHRRIWPSAASIGWSATASATSCSTTTIRALAGVARADALGRRRPGAERRSALAAGRRGHAGSV
jgi:hypothetical protein